MSKTVNVGGNRLGSGNKINVTMHGYQRSNHDLSYLWKSTMAPGTLVPFMVIPGMPGDTFDIDLDSVVKTHPTIGPLFGSFKLQLDVFNVPIRLYSKILHNNKLGIGMKMNQVYFPRLKLSGNALDNTSKTPIEFQQINQSSILAYLGIRGLGWGLEGSTPITGFTSDKFNAIPYLAYFDIFKNYYANKMEEDAYIIDSKPPFFSMGSFSNFDTNTNSAIDGLTPVQLSASGVLSLIGDNLTKDNVLVEMYISAGNTYKITLGELALNDLSILDFNGNGTNLSVFEFKDKYNTGKILSISIDPELIGINTNPLLRPFNLSLIDEMREQLLSADPDIPFIIDENSPEPYSIPLTKQYNLRMAAVNCQEGLLVKTYQSDIFNNWVNSDLISGSDSIAELSKVSTAGNSFTIDTLNLSKKVYDMLNRIAVSGGSYEDYLEAVYDHNSKWRAETPIYCGGLSKEIVFQEIVSQAASDGDPLGSLAGKGVMANKHKGGKVVVTVDEPCYIIGIVSITPRICYSQGNEWHTQALLTMDDFHKPALDGIGYQDLVTNQMAFWDSYNAGIGEGIISFNSAGKQPAWLNYMTNYDKSYGNFADERSQMFMTLNRRYESIASAIGMELSIKDLTTYIDPAKFNYAFAQTDLSAMNFWVQIANNITARRKMSAKMIPNL